MYLGSNVHQQALSVSGKRDGFLSPDPGPLEMLLFMISRDLDLEIKLFVHGIGRSARPQTRSNGECSQMSLTWHILRDASVTCEASLRLIRSFQNYELTNTNTSIFHRHFVQPSPSNLPHQPHNQRQPPEIASRLFSSHPHYLTQLNSRWLMTMDMRRGIRASVRAVVRFGRRSMRSSSIPITTA